MSGTATGTWVGELAQRHLDAAYNLARWLLGSDGDAADAVHDAFLRAARSAHTYAGGNDRAWWLAIVRNCCMARLAARSRERRLTLVGRDADETAVSFAGGSDVEERVDATKARERIVAQLRALPLEFREVLVLRELEDLSYREIADVLGVPIGTVMSRLARGRALLQRAFGTATKEPHHGMH